MGILKIIEEIIDSIAGTVLSVFIVLFVIWPFMNAGFGVLFIKPLAILLMISLLWIFRNNIYCFIKTVVSNLIKVK